MNKEIRYDFEKEEENNMSKALLLSVKPKYVSMILNKTKTIEVRKRFPKEYKGWVHIYCTKEDNLCCMKKVAHNDRYVCGKDFDLKDFPQLSSGYDGKGKVVARFYCDKVEPIWCSGFYEDLSFDKGKCIDSYKTDTHNEQTLLEESCLTEEEMHDYFDCECQRWAIHISQLEIFDEPKELSEFYKASCKSCFAKNTNYCDEKYCRITKAPQSYMFIEVVE